MTRFSVALEITPPRERNPAILLRRARLLGASADSIHVIQRPGRQTSLDASSELARAGLAAVWHVVNRGRSSAEIDREIERAAREGLRAALVVRGEGALADAADTPPLRAVVARIRAALPAARVGVTFDPYLDRARSFANLWPKLEAGASFVQTQPLLSAATLHGFGEAIRTRAPHVAIVPMVIPLLSAAAAEKLALRLRLPLPEGLVARLARGGATTGWELFARTVRELEASGLADGVAVMTQEMDPNEGFAARLRAALPADPVRAD